MLLFESFLRGESKRLMLNHGQHGQLGLRPIDPLPGGPRADRIV